jgi:hypothetical protein
MVIMAKVVSYHDVLFRVPWCTINDGKREREREREREK